MKRTKIAIVIAVAAMVTAAGCSKFSKSGKSETVITIKQQEGQPLAQVGKTTLTVEAMKEDFQQRQGQFKGAPNLNSEKARNDFVENQVLQEAMFLDAVEQNYFARPDILRDIKKIVVQRLMRDKLEKAQNEFVASDEQIEKHYNENLSLYNRGESVKVAFISVLFGSNKEKAKEVAMALHKEAVATAKANPRLFSRLAITYAQKIMDMGKASVETNETDYLEKTAFEARFGANTFDLINKMESTGDIAPLMTTENAYIVVMKSGGRAAINESLADAKPKIIKRLAYESRGDQYKKYTEELRKKYNITINKELIAELSKDIPAPEKMGEPAAMPGADKLAMPKPGEPLTTPPAAMPVMPPAPPAPAKVIEQGSNN